MQPECTRCVFKLTNINVQLYFGLVNSTGILNKYILDFILFQLSSDQWFEANDEELNFHGIKIKFLSEGKDYDCVVARKKEQENTIKFKGMDCEIQKTFLCQKVCNPPVECNYLLISVCNPVFTITYFLFFKNYFRSWQGDKLVRMG